MDVFGDTVARRPCVVEVQAHAVSCLDPLGLEMGGGSDNDDAPPLLCKRPSGAGESERGLARPWRCDGQKVGSLAGRELVERGALPRTELETVAHEDS